jgi:hypothetical protein
MPDQLTIATGRRHVLVLHAELVELRLEWPSHLVDRLPDDFKVVLSGPAIPTQEKTKADATASDDLRNFEFEWKDKGKDVELKASGNGQEVVLWQQQVAGNLEQQIDWNERLHPLLGDPEDVEISEGSTGGDGVPDDLRSDQLNTLFEDVA